MKIISIKSTIPTFREVHFHDGLNLILGNRSSRTDSSSGHNVGKSSALRIIDYVLFGKRHKDYSPGWQDRFGGEEFVIQTHYKSKLYDFCVKIAKRVTIDDDTLREIRDNQKILSYLIRFKGEFEDEYNRPSSFKGKDINWKPFVFGMLGFNSEIMQKKMALNIEYNNVENVIKAIDSADVKEIDRTEIVNRLQNESDQIKKSLADFNFFHYEKTILTSRLNAISEKYSEIRSEIRMMESDAQRITMSLNQIRDAKFDIYEISRIYRDCGILLAEAAVKDFGEVEEFNKKLIISRRRMLEDMLSQAKRQIERLLPEAKRISEQRAKYARVLTIKDYKEEYDALQMKLIELEKEISVLTVPVFQKSKQEFIEKMNQLEIDLAHHTVALRDEANSTSQKFKLIRKIYERLIAYVLKIQASLVISENSNSNFNFTVDIKDNGTDLLTLKGDAFKRLSCGIFDIAVAISSEEKQIIAHDGILDGISSPIKMRYMVAAHTLCRQYGIQYLISAINENFPTSISRRCMAIELSDTPKSKTLFGTVF